MSNIWRYLFLRTRSLHNTNSFDTIIMRKINKIGFFLIDLTSKTQNGSCKWEEISSKVYRLQLKTGSIKFSAVYHPEYDCYDFILELYDMKKCFYTIYGSKITDRNDNHFEALNSLYEVIEAWNKAKIDSKLSSLENENRAM